MANFADTFTGTGFLATLSGSQVSGGALENIQPNYWASPFDVDNDGHIQLGSISSSDALSCAGHPITICAWIRKSTTSSVNNFSTLINSLGLRNRLEAAVTAVIGPVTAQAAESVGFSPSIQPEVATIESLAQAIVEYYDHAP